MVGIDNPRYLRHLAVHLRNPHINYVLEEKCCYCKLARRNSYGNIFRRPINQSVNQRNAIDFENLRADEVIIDLTRPIVNTARPIVNTARPTVNTTIPIVNTARPNANTTIPSVNTTRPNANTTRSIVNNTRQNDSVNIQSVNIQSVNQNQLNTYH